MSPPIPPSHRFEIALSFAGDSKRSKVHSVAELLRAALGDGKVFFDEWFEAELAGHDAQIVLQNIYLRSTRLVVTCVCQRYNEKPWTQEEWRAIQAFERRLRDAGTANKERMRFLPLRFGDGEVDGIFETAIVPDVRDRTSEEIARLILQRLCLAKAESPLEANQVAIPPAAVGPLKALSDHDAHLSSVGEATPSSFRGKLQPQPEGGSFVHSRTGIELMRIRAGTFGMGSAPGEGDSDERPQRQVRISDFYLARYPVTNRHYKQFLRANPGASAPRFWQTTRTQSCAPVVGISLPEASAFAEWAGLRLPTEEEWEYACRAGTNTQYSSGNDPADLAMVAWYLDNASSVVDVGLKPPNAFGLHDMHGNIREWCATEYWGYGAPELPALNHEHLVRLLREFDSFRLRAVVRGGAWNTDAASARSAARHWVRTSRRDAAIGFRVARDF